MSRLNNIEIPEKLSKNQLEFIKETLSDRRHKRIFDLFMRLVKYSAICFCAYLLFCFVRLCFLTSQESMESTKGFIYSTTNFMIDIGKKMGIASKANLSGWAVALIMLGVIFTQKRTIKTQKKQITTKDQQIRTLEKKLADKENPAILEGKKG